MTLYIKHMVSKSCVMMVKSEFDKLGVPYESVSLGIVSLSDNISASQRRLLNDTLEKLGFELCKDKKDILISKIKASIIEIVHFRDEPPKEKTSVYLSKLLHHNYTYLSNLFSEEMGITIEQYVIAHKVERVKEFILNDEYSITQIASKMHYCSVAHLSYQFKKVTGLTPSQFKRLKLYRKRVKLDDIGRKQPGCADKTSLQKSW